MSLSAIDVGAQFIAPLHSHSLYNRGLTYYDLKEYPKAITDYDRATQLNPQYTAAYHNRGVAYYGLKEYQKEIADYDRALQLDPNFTRAKNNRKEAYRLLQGRS
ncbi:MAG TPA: tetratricopeptide repeat protein [Ktedonobacteraceae bacterium]